MGVETLSSRAIIGMYYRTLEQDPGARWIPWVSMMFDSDQPSETYKWLGQVPAFREWTGGRQAKGFSENGITIINKHYEATIEFLKREVRRDKTGQVRVRIAEFAQRSNSHWASLLTSLMVSGESTVCYDGQFFFDTDHSEGASGTQSNDLSVDISALPASVHGSTTAPSVEEMQQSILKAVEAIYSFKDDRGEPMNEMATQFAVMVPTSLWSTALSAVTLPLVAGGNTNVIPANADFRIAVCQNARLPWTDKFAVYRADGSVRAFITQEEQGVEMKVKGEGSEFEFDFDAWQFGIDTWRNVGFGYWQNACMVTMT